MKTEKLMTAGAVAFAAFALWYVFRKPGGQVAAQPGQRQRDDALLTWIGLQNDQQRTLAGANVAGLYGVESFLGVKL